VLLSAAVCEAASTDVFEWWAECCWSYVDNGNQLVYIAAHIYTAWLTSLMMMRMMMMMLHAADDAGAGKDDVWMSLM